jgi:serine protease Do
VVGVNTFIIAEGNNLGFSLPSDSLLSSLNDYAPFAGKKVYRCRSCSFLIETENFSDEYCPNCGVKINLEDYRPAAYQPAGVAVRIETILTKLGKDVPVSRIGPDQWEVDHGSVKVKIMYNRQSRFVVADALLCNLPKTNIAAIYEFMLRENYNDGNPVFSVNNQSILLSVIVYEDDLSEESGEIIFRKLFENADHYDGILIGTYGAVPCMKEEE